MTKLFDLVQPFQLDRPNLRGRLVRLGPAISAIISRHDYPDPVAKLLAESLTLVVLLAGMLKFDGIFTLQTKGDGPLGLLVADISHKGALRGYAQYDADAIAKLGDTPTAAALLGKGYVAFTVDQGMGGDRYQGIVELSGDSLADFVQSYFKQSEQIDTALKVEVCRDHAFGWRTGGIMLQRLPEQRAQNLSDAEEDDWRRAMLLMNTATLEELISPELPVEDLLYRLFHEEEVRVYTSHDIQDECRCSRERVATVLCTLPEEDLVHIAETGKAEVRCEFCSRNYAFTAEEIRAEKAEKARREVMMDEADEGASALRSRPHVLNDNKDNSFDSDEAGEDLPTPPPVRH